MRLPPRCARPYEPKTFLLRQRRKPSPTFLRPANNVNIIRTKRLVLLFLPPLMKPWKNATRKARPDALSRKLASTMDKSHPTTPPGINTHLLLDRATFQKRGIKSPHRLPIMLPTPRVMNWQYTSNQEGWPNSRSAPLLYGLRMLY